MSEQENAYDDDKLSMKEYREVYGEPSPLEKAIARKEGRDLPSSKKEKKKKSPKEKIVRQLKDLTQDEKDELLKQLFEE